MLDKIIIIDFEDSFTYNIASLLYPLEPNLKVVFHEIFFKNMLDDLFLSHKKIAVILGPGPGHPKDYSNYFFQIKKLMEHPSVYLMGICLGHQILGLISDLEVRPSLNQLHGQAVKINFRNKSILVQKYNSLAVFQNGEEVDILSFKRGVSYQFHPESIGTTQNEIFFQDLLNFIK